ncbi:MAG: DUF2207 domain-containing protein [Microthrixaceae bacterium]
MAEHHVAPGRSWPAGRSGARCRVAVAVAAVVAGLWWGGPAARAQGVERITDFRSTVVIESDGSIEVTETIHYDFGSSSRHGIYRDIPTRFEWAGTPPKGAPEGAHYERLTPVSDISVSSSDAPSDLEVIDQGNSTRLKIGSPSRTISGRHTYTIHYRLAGVFSAFAEHDELYLNVTGNGWRVPIASAEATVTAPGTVTRVACYEGSAGSRLGCTTADAAGDTATFRQDHLGAGEGLTVVLALAKGVVADPSATTILKERRTLASAFALTPWTGMASGAVLLVGFAGVAVLGWRNGRDRRFSGSAVDVAFGNEDGGEVRVPLFDRPHDPVEFVPPDGIRPGHMGTLWDERANPLDVSAMIVDLAVRGWLRIDEIAPASGGFLGFGRDEGDFQMVKLRNPASDPTATELLPSEALLLTSLFQDGDTARLSELKTQFAKRLELIESRLYDDAVAAGWFPTRPDLVRSRWASAGMVLTVLGGVGTWLAAKATHFALVPVAIMLVGVVLAFASPFFPHRTAKGSALLGRVRGFKELFDAGEGERQRFAEQHHLFAQYLPYAIVFGCTEKWAKVFADLGLTPQEMGLGEWYTSTNGYDPIHFGYAMGSFTTRSSGAIAAAAPSSSGGSGFSGGSSGGGFGGGGGGSW